MPAGTRGLADTADDDAPPLTADELEQILVPQHGEPGPNGAGGGVRQRGLIPGAGVDGDALPPPGRKGSGVVPDLRLLFGRDSAELTRESKARLDELARALRSDKLKDLSFEIAGHTDATGDPDYNMRLSRRRAEAVAAYLSRTHRVPRQRLEARGYGPAAPADPRDPMSPKNRRVEVRTLQ